MKDLEQEYKKQVQEEMPDLWNRIEPNLAPKKKKPWIRRYAPLTSVAAAALVLLAGMPGLLNLQRMGQDNTSAADCAPRAEKTEGYAQEAAEENGEDSCGAPQMFAATDGVETGTTGAGAVTEDTTADGGQTGASGAGAVTEGTAAEEMNDTAAVQETDEKEAAGESADEENAVLKTEYSEDITAEDAGMTVRVTVASVDEADGRTVYTLTDGEKFACLAVAGEEVVPLEKGKMYLVTLRGENAEAWRYVVECAEETPAE